MRGEQSFTNCSVGLQLDSGNARSIKWSIHKVVLMSEQLPEGSMASYRNSFKDNFFQMIQFPNKPLKKIICAFDKISLVLQTVLEWEARSFSPTLQLDFNRTLEMSDWQNDRFARSPDNLKSSVSTICISLETSSLSPTIEVDFSWTLEMSDRKDDRFEKPSETLKSSVSTICIS